ncbi:hypothetical protein [Salinimicrobium soli]|uniref:hypothetical protein n=1 Tax=Salinimicrobium soli TaxID=1254399 RepID=UPI003AAE9079
MDKVVIHFNSTLPHFIQIFAGLEYLREKGDIDTEYRLELSRYPVNILKVSYKGRNLFFDMADNSEINAECYEEADFYIKRMLLHSDFEKSNKLYPFGLNYLVFYENRFLKKAFLKQWKLLQYSIRFSRTVSGLLDVRGCINNNSVHQMQNEPSGNKQIIFRTRLWDPERNSVEWKKEERERLNNERIVLNRLLKEKYSNDFLGGIEKSELALKKCPDLLLRKAEYHKKEFLTHLKNSGIGIVNQGLEKSIGWKFGEYVAHSMAVVSNPIDKYKLFGPLTEGENYLKYQTTEDCIAAIDHLHRDDRLRLEMQKANKSYYDNYLHPGVKIAKIFSMLGF